MTLNVVCGFVLSCFKIVFGCLVCLWLCSLFQVVSGCSRLLQVVPGCTVVEVIMVCNPASNHVRLFRALLDCFGHLESNKLSKLFSAAMVRYLV